eukprot:5984752-Prymnesium_polylepis.1
MSACSRVHTRGTRPFRSNVSRFSPQGGGCAGPRSPECPATLPDRSLGGAPLMEGLGQAAARGRGRCEQADGDV